MSRSRGCCTHGSAFRIRIFSMCLVLIEMTLILHLALTIVFCPVHCHNTDSPSMVRGSDLVISCASHAVVASSNSSSAAAQRMQSEEGETATIPLAFGSIRHEVCHSVPVTSTICHDSSAFVSKHLLLSLAVSVFDRDDHPHSHQYSFIRLTLDSQVTSLSDILNVWINDTVSEADDGAQRLLLWERESTWVNDSNSILVAATKDTAPNGILVLVLDACVRSETNSPLNSVASINALVSALSVTGVMHVKSITRGPGRIRAFENLETNVAICRAPETRAKLPILPEDQLRRICNLNSNFIGRVCAIMELIPPAGVGELMTLGTKKAEKSDYNLFLNGYTLVKVYQTQQPRKRESADFFSLKTQNLILQLLAAPFGHECKTLPQWYYALAEKLLFNIAIGNIATSPPISEKTPEEKFLAEYKSRDEPRYFAANMAATKRAASSTCGDNFKLWINNCVNNFLQGAKCHSQWMKDIQTQYPLVTVDKLGMLLARNMGANGDNKFTGFGTCALANGYVCGAPVAAASGGSVTAAPLTCTLPPSTPWVSQNMVLLRQCYRMYTLSGVAAGIPDTSAYVSASFEDIPLSKVATDGTGDIIIESASNIINMGATFTLDSKTGRVVEVACLPYPGDTATTGALTLTYPGAGTGTFAADGAWAKQCMSNAFSIGDKHRWSQPDAKWKNSDKVLTVKTWQKDANGVPTPTVATTADAVTTYNSYLSAVIRTLAVVFPNIIVENTLSYSNPPRRSHSGCLVSLTKAMGRYPIIDWSGLPDQAGHIVAAKMSAQLSYQSNADPINFMPQPPTSNNPVYAHRVTKKSSTSSSSSSSSLRKHFGPCNWGAGENVVTGTWTARVKGAFDCRVPDDEKAGCVAPTCATLDGGFSAALDYPTESGTPEARKIFYRPTCNRFVACSTTCTAQSEDEKSGPCTYGADGM